MRMTGGESPTVSRLCWIPGVDWLLAEQEKFSSSTSLRHVDLDGGPHGNGFAYEATQQHMVVSVTEAVHLG